MDFDALPGVAEPDTEPGVVVPDEAAALQAAGGVYMNLADTQIQPFDFRGLEFLDGISNDYRDGFASLLFGVEFPTIDGGANPSDDMMKYLNDPGTDQDGSTDGIASSSPPASSPPTSPEDFSAYLSQPSDSPTINLDAPLPWNYSDLEATIAYDRPLVEAYNMVIDKIKNGDMPTKDDFHNFVFTRRGRYYCAVEGCTWNERGWKREDRGVAHVKKEHFRLLNYRCEECNRDYKWSHDLRKHERSKHPQDGQVPLPRYHCHEPGCEQSFGKSSNLTRHRKVHKKSAGRRKART